MKRLLLLLPLSSLALLAQTATIAPAAASGVLGSPISITINLSGSASPAALQFTVTPSTGLTFVSAAAGSAATSAAKDIQCNAGASFVCIVSGLNVNVIADGAVAVLTYTVGASAVGVHTFTIGSTSATNANADALASAGGSASVTIPIPKTQVDGSISFTGGVTIL